MSERARLDISAELPRRTRATADSDQRAQRTGTL